MQQQLKIQTLFLILLATLVCRYAHAQNVITINSITRASNVELGSGTAIPVVYGGLAGRVCASPDDFSDTTTCDNCTLPEEACNTRRIHSGLKLKISFTVTANISGEVFFGYSDNGTITALNDANKTSGNLTQGDTGFIEVFWGDLCDAALGDSTCADPATALTDPNNGAGLVTYINIEDSAAFTSGKTQQINIDLRSAVNDVASSSANTIICTDLTSVGICAFNARAGDEKVTIENLSIAEVGGTCDNDVYEYARVFYAEDDGATGPSIANYLSNYTDLKLGENCEPSGDWSVSGLQNDVDYYFRLAMVDIANNTVLLTDFTGEILANDGAGDDCAAPANDAGCSYYARPGNVVGLLPEDLNCFIATAAFGSSFNDKVSIFREFRNLILLKSSLGKSFVKKYYSWGPYAARFIADKPILRATARGLLLPLWGYAWFSLHYGWVGAIFISILYIAFAIGLTLKIKTSLQNRISHQWALQRAMNSEAV